MLRLSDDIAVLPTNRDRLAVFGMTGTGKTVAGLYQLSRKDLSVETWIIVDYKGEDYIADLETLGAKVIDIDGTLPDKPGLYIVRPDIDAPDADNAIARFWRAIHRRRNIGVYVDEGYMVPDSRAYDSLLTQGRSLCIPMIVLSQRPRFVTRFVVSEAQFVQVFGLTDDDDWQRVREFVPLVNWNDDAPGFAPPEYHSWWYQVKGRKLFRFSPVPNMQEILAVFDRQLSKRRNVKVI